MAFRRSKHQEPVAPPGPLPEPASITAWVVARLAEPGWGRLELQAGDKVIEPPRSPANPPMTTRSGAIAVRYRAVQLHAAGASLIGDEARAVLGRVAHTYRRSDTDELRRLRAAATVLAGLQASAPAVDVALGVVRWADDAYQLIGPPVAPLAGVDVPPISAGYLAAFGPVVDRALELRDALVRGGTVTWLP
jgi:hypothetical protein